MTDDITDQDLRNHIDPLIATDALLDDPAAHAGHDELATLFAGWRAECDLIPHPELVDAATALAVIAAHRERSWPSPWLAVLVGFFALALGFATGALIVWLALLP